MENNIFDNMNGDNQNDELDTSPNNNNLDNDNVVDNNSSSQFNNNYNMGNIFFNNQNDVSDNVNRHTYLNDRGNMEEKHKFDFNRYNDIAYQSNLIDGNSINKTQSIKSSHKKIVTIIILIILVFAGLFVASNLFLNKDSVNKNNNIDNNGLVIKDTPQTNNNVETSGILSGTAVAEKVKPSIVGVVTYSNKNTFEAAGIGSGIIMSDDGYIITNAHVIDKSNGIKIVLSNGDEHEASIIGMDVKTDLAVVKIDANNLTPAEFGDSSKLKEGQDVMAIGNPSGLELSGSITKGIVSGVDRKITSYGGLLINAIQTDAAINPGNSGGALVNEYGQVIGINTAKIAQNDVEGIGFAIPINDAKPIIDNLIQYGYVKDRVRLGITFVMLDEITSKMNNLPIGAYIKAIDERSDMYKKGIRPGDVLLEFNGTPINNEGSLASELLKYKPGQQVRIKIYRKETPTQGKNMDLTITLQEDSPQIFGIEWNIKF